jgi:hypothetical protein
LADNVRVIVIGSRAKVAINPRELTARREILSPKD